MTGFGVFVLFAAISAGGAVFGIFCVRDPEIGEKGEVYEDLVPTGEE